MEVSIVVSCYLKQKSNVQRLNNIGKTVSEMQGIFWLAHTCASCLKCALLPPEGRLRPGGVLLLAPSSCDVSSVAVATGRPSHGSILRQFPECLEASRWSNNPCREMEFQPPYFPPPFPGTASVQASGQDVFSQHLQASDPYQQYAVRDLML